MIFSEGNETELQLNQTEYIQRPVGLCGGARGVMVIVVGNGHGDTSSNPGPG